ncbi:MAG: DUF4393 domain-containing protein [Phycisphaeraceae bacterium]|nr:DUF4393 domain-containing protein [Phycisphaeraceae bacterium]
MTETSIAEVMSKALDLGKPVVEKACEFLDSMLGKPCRVAGGMLGDQIYAWQWSNRLRIIAKAEEKVRARKVAPCMMPPGFLMPLLDGAGNCDSSSLEAMWVSLLAGAVEHEPLRHPAFPEVLRRLSPADGKLLDRLYSDPTAIIQLGKDMEPALRIKFPPHLDALIDIQKIELALEDVPALSVLVASGLMLETPQHPTMFYSLPKTYMRTDFGWQFATAVGIVPIPPP